MMQANCRAEAVRPPQKGSQENEHDNLKIK